MRDQVASDFVRLVREALLHLDDPGFLQTHRLAVLVAARDTGSAGSAGALVRRWLLNAVESLRPAASLTATPGARVHRLMELRYVEGADVPSVRRQLSISKSSYYRDHELGLAAATSVLRERLGDGSPSSAQTERAVGVVPRPLTRLLGRESELVAVEQLLDPGSDGTRLMTIIGAPGVGKTRLALEAARRLADRFEGRVRFVALAPLTGSALVLPTIASSLGLRNADGHGVGSVRGALADVPSLLVLDNCEHVMAAAPEIADLLEACPELRVLATSRAGLRVRGEHVFHLAPMPLPDPAKPVSPDVLLACPATRLFVDRAQAVRPGFLLTESNAEAVAELCRRLEGIPLAIELAATRADILEPSEMLPLLGSRLALSSDRGGEPARQQTLREAISWSYRLLAPPDRALFRRLAVFAGGFSLASAAEVVGDRRSRATDAELLDGLSRLVNASLLNRSNDATGRTRFTMLETIRELALERLTRATAGRGEIDQMRRRHALAFLELAQSLRSTHHQDRSFLMRMEIEADNMRAALDWLSQAGEIEASLLLASELWEIWYARGYLAEGRGRLARVLEQAGATAPTLRARLLFRAGMLAHQQNDLAGARELHSASLSLYEQLGDAGGRVDALQGLALVALREHDYAAADGLSMRTLELAAALPLPYVAGWSHRHLGFSAILRKEWAVAERHGKSALPLFRESENKMGVSWALWLIGYAMLWRDDLDGAVTYLMEALVFALDFDYVWSIAWGLEGFARVASIERDPDRALRLLAGAAAIRRGVGAPAPPAWQAELDRLADDARTALGPETAEAAWLAGLALDRRAAASLAMARTGRAAVAV